MSTALPLAIVGEARAVTTAAGIARAGGIACETLALESRDAFRFALGPARDRYPPGTWRVFVALDERAVNQARIELVAQAAAAGWTLASVVSPLAFVDPSAALGANVLVAPGVQVGPEASVGEGSILRANAVVAAGAQVGAGCTLGEAAQLRAGARLGRGCTLGPGCTVAETITIGEHSELLLSVHFAEAVPARSFFDLLLPHGARIVGRRTTD